MSDKVLIEKFDYAVTLQIPAFKKINYNGKYQAYHLFDGESQKNYLRYIILESYLKVVGDNAHGLLFHYERHTLCKYGRYHVHFTIPELLEHKIREIQEHICKKLGIKTLKQSMEIFYYITKRSYGWEHYITKDSLADLESDLMNY